MELVAGFARRGDGGSIYDDLQQFLAQKLDVVVDFTVYPISRRGGW